MHTGCDTISAFVGKGKLSALKLIKKRTGISNVFFRANRIEDDDEFIEADYENDEDVDLTDYESRE